MTFTRLGESEARSVARATVPSACRMSPKVFTSDEQLTDGRSVPFKVNAGRTQLDQRETANGRQIA